MAVTTKPISLADIEELETGLQMRELLARIREFLQAHEADHDLISAIEFAIEDNEHWVDPDLEKMLADGQLKYGQG